MNNFSIALNFYLLQYLFPQNPLKSLKLSFASLCLICNGNMKAAAFRKSKFFDAVSTDRIVIDRIEIDEITIDQKAPTILKLIYNLLK